MFKDSNVTLNLVDSTAGSVASEGTGNIDVDEVLTFNNGNTAQLSYPPAEPVS